MRILSRRKLMIAAGLSLPPGCTAISLSDPASLVSDRDFTAAVLCYHQFGEHIGNALMVSTATLEAQLRLIANGGFTAIPARRLVERRLGRGAALPDRSCVLTIDDGYKSIYTIFFPLAVKYRIPATLFIYPSAISILPFALTWEELAEMKATGLIEVQSHTYTHPNLGLEERLLSGAAFDAFARRELEVSRAVIERRLGSRCDLLAWPYGIVDPELKADARRAGYVAAFGIARHRASQNDDIMALPRYMVTERNRGSSFERLLLGSM
jgi:peptidoglycan/xylan/chitin deacetylase (PgdA/CDA1 family)